MLLLDIKVSIIVPSYKREYILVKRALDSLLTQTYPNIEIIIIDDNGFDDLAGYREGLKKLISDINSEKTIYYANEKNIGGALSRNKGINLATGEYITFLDDDDRYLPKKIETQLKFMLENNLDMSFTDLSIYNEKDKLTDYREYSKIKAFDKKSLFEYHLTRQITGTPTFMCKKALLKKICGFDDVKIGHEYYLMAKIILSDAKIGYIPHSDVVAYRTTAETISTGINKIAGQLNLYKYKKSFFKELKFHQRQFVRCRHYAIMSASYKRNGRIFLALCFFLLATVVSPINTLREGFSFFSRIKKNKKKKVCTSP